ncbi:MAG TPA: hypothetical protein VGN01_11415 [Acidobacteriaceae bacterium]|jgi:hypothetical protein
MTAGIVRALTLLSITTFAAAQTAPPATPVQPFSGISSITTLDNHGAVTSTTCCALMEIDGAGRRLTAHIDSANFGAPLRRASISDPIALKLIIIDYASRMATVTLLPASAAARITPTDKPFASEDATRGEVGDKTIDGIKVHGYIWVTKAPDGSGSAGGGAGAEVSSRFNPAAYPITNEWWWSPELHVFTQITQVDANGNKWIQKYEKIQPSAPNASAFAVPSGFRIVTNPTPPDTQ